MKLSFIKKIAALLIVVGVVVSVNSVTNFTLFTETSYLFMGLLGLGVMALGRLRHV
jgi:hypothetical protein